MGGWRWFEWASGAKGQSRGSIQARPLPAPFPGRQAVTLRNTERSKGQSWLKRTEALGADTRAVTTQCQASKLGQVAWREGTVWLPLPGEAVPTSGHNPLTEARVPESGHGLYLQLSS